MPAIEADPTRAEGSARDDQGQLHFPPVTRDHILNCSYDAWFPKYRTSCIKSRIIPLTPEFVSYIREDGIVLADEGNNNPDDDDWEPTNPSKDYPAPPRDPNEPEYSDDSEDEAEPLPPRLPPNKRFPTLHAQITSAIAELGGTVAPKLNWSSPKDATWISRHPNTVKCTSANDVYVLLKSSSFISHDLDHAFDDTVPSSSMTPPFQPVLVLRSFFNPLPSLEFRCFVKGRNLIGITQRDPNYYAFLNSLRPHIVKRIKEFFLKRLKFTFPDACFVFDVYVPEAGYDSDERLGRARLIDINPWAPRTDSILFDWGELLDTRVERPVLGGALSEADQKDHEGGGDSWDDDESEEEEGEYVPELRIVEKDDPLAYNFSSPAYSAHKMPKEVVDASMAGEGGMREFADQWRRMQEAQQQVQGQGQGQGQE
ncbi:putative cell division cycle protein [Podospora fimiseda]|uniref:Cell division cycle protein n=1 Tax=Podospora fimiseda TaxID=252190 RepID=A0AAN6YMP3_9PEZI|nr:putative cell division cycle protein [Podospora fimiseda]